MGEREGERMAYQITYCGTNLGILNLHQPHHKFTYMYRKYACTFNSGEVRGGEGILCAT